MKTNNNSLRDEEQLLMFFSLNQDLTLPRVLINSTRCPALEATKYNQTNKKHEHVFTVSSNMDISNAHCVGCLTYTVHFL